MRKSIVAVLILTLLLLLLPASVQPRAQAATSCPAIFLPAHGSTVRIVVPLLVVLEWNAQGSTACAQWAATMTRASAFLENGTHGQVALGPVTILDNAQDWQLADIQVHVQNTGIPDATVGGLAPGIAKAIGGNPGPSMLSATSTISSGGVFTPGAIHVGRTWSEFGPRRGRWSDPDGFRTIMHELGHYVFYLYDEYFGYTESGGTAMRTAASCTTQLFDPSADVLNPLPDQPAGASVMYWEYALHGFWTGRLPVASTAGATAGAITGSAGCTNGRQWQVYGEPDWKTIAQHYPIGVPSGIGTGAPPPPACSDCSVIGPNRWLFNLTQADTIIRQYRGSTLCSNPNTNGQVLSLPCLQADGYLVKAGDRAVLHEGVP
ncbi:MAG TPA: hypothetical protein VHB98_05520, partial [Chloroflexota bacterium]|nr:hypothetical protein [Chloroflexota bacterium]